MGGPVPPTVLQINLYVLPPAPLISALNALVGGPGKYNLISISRQEEEEGEEEVGGAAG